jgi:hypothetical protein
MITDSRVKGGDKEKSKHIGFYANNSIHAFPVPIMGTLLKARAENGIPIY